MENKTKNLELERLVFFSDAVVAIAITLLALELRIEHTENGHLTFRELLENKQKFAAFFLSFINIAIFWKIHHEFFRFIKSINDRLLFYNICWLLSIVLLPFTTSLISLYFGDVAAMFSYCANTFAVTFFQNQIWDYVAYYKPELLKKDLDAATNHENRVSCNVAMLNGLLTMAVSFVSPLSAFILVLLRYPMILFSLKIFRYKPSAKPKN